MTVYRLTSVVVIAAATLTMLACGSDAPSEPSPLPTAPYSQTDLRVGTGAEATQGRRITVHYTGWLFDPDRPEQKGTQFDSSISRGTPLPFTVGAGEVIRGWDQGVIGMRVGGQRRLVIPPELGYGAAGRGSIPGNATLVFDIELLAVN